MTVEFTKEHYQFLLKAINVYEVVVKNGTNTSEESEKEIEKVDNFLDLLFDLKEKFAMEEIEVTDIQNNSVEMLQNYNDIITVYNMANHLALRDLQSKFSEEELESWDDETFDKKAEPYVKKYYAEFMESGFENLIVQK